MEIRRVQMTGGSSFIITLPKEWVKKLNIGKNDPIGLIQQPDGSLLVTPKMDKEPTIEASQTPTPPGAEGTATPNATTASLKTAHQSGAFGIIGNKRI